MGTSGTDKFHEYRDPKDGERHKKEEKGSPAGGARGSGSGGTPPKGGNKCAAPITNVALEEIALCAYFATHRTVPPLGTPVSVNETLIQGRVAVVTTTGEVVGYMPDEYSYLRRCVEQGFSYNGTVVLSASRPIPTVRISLTAQQ